jgi:hypothetical protein
MAKSNLTRSAGLHFRIAAFGVLFATLVVCFDPLTAYLLALVASNALSIM